jgi:hypothetical protein
MNTVQNKGNDPPKLFDVLLHHLEPYSGHQIHISDLLNAIGDRGFGLTFMLFGLLAAVLPTGLCSVMALPIILFAIQLLIGRTRPTIPKRFDRKTFDANLISTNIQKSQKYLDWFEHFAKPRWQLINQPMMIRFAAIICICLASIILMPGPLTNTQTGFAVMIIGLAIAERDGLLLLFSFFASISAFFVSITAFVAFISLIQRWLS